MWVGGPIGVGEWGSGSELGMQGPWVLRVECKQELPCVALLIAAVRHHRWLVSK